MQEAKKNVRNKDNHFYLKPYEVPPFEYNEVVFEDPRGQIYFDDGDRLEVKDLNVLDD